MKKPEDKLPRKITLAVKKAQPLSGDLKKRIIDVKAILPKSGITSLLIFRHPELNNVKKKSLIANVLQLRQTDENITVKLEALAETLKETI